MRYMRLIRSRMYQRPLVGRICCAASMVSSLSPCVYFVLATAIWPAGALGGGLFVYADRVIQVKQGMRGKPGGVHIFHLVRSSPQGAGELSRCMSQIIPRRSWTGGSTTPSMGLVRLARTTNSRAEVGLPVNNRKFTGDSSELNLYRYVSYLLPTSGPAGSDLDRNRRHGTHLGFDLPQIKPGRVIRAGLAHGPFIYMSRCFRSRRRNCKQTGLLARASEHRWKAQNGKIQLIFLLK